MSDHQKKEVNSFLDIPINSYVKVHIKDIQVYDLGYIKKLYATDDKYAVWQDDQENIWYESSDREIIKQEDFHKFWNRYQLIRSRSQKNLDDESKKAYLGMLASSIASALEGQFMAAAESLDAAIAFVTTANERISRRRFTIGAILAFFLSIIFSFFLKAEPSESNLLLIILQYSMIGGAIGALLSALAGRREILGFDPNANCFEGISNGAIRVFYGIVSAFVAVLIIKSEIITTPLITPKNEHLALIVIAIAGGFAERWAADLIHRFTSEVDINNQKLPSEK
ncbi:MAG: hypothetical protein HWE18_06835 [Gammaproteobacteria bacterium]|nr:hypothetical protein [Gammaproteobacteria bacterium]